jgi:predicted MFS family arabinose efflux permease
MSANRVRLFLICMLGAFVIAGFLAPYGLLVGPIAAALDAEIGVVGSLFSFFTGSIFVGYIVAFYIFDYVNVKTIVVGGYAAVVLAVALVILTPGLTALSIALSIIGFCCSLVICGSVTLISQTWQGKQRQSALVAQDAAFNGGGIFFTAITAYLLGKNVAWQVGYVPAAAFAFITIALALFTRLRIRKQSDDEVGATTEWNAGIIIVGVLVMLFMTAKLTFIVWAPQYLQQEFGASPGEAGILMSNVFQAAFIGSLIGTYIVSKIPIHYFLAAMTLIGAVATFVMLSTESLPVVIAIGYLFGLSVSATFNSYMAFALGFVASPNHRHVAYMLLAGAVGSGIGPFISGQAVLVTETTRTPMNLAFALLALVFVCVIILSSKNVRVKLQSMSRSFS